MEQDKKKFLLSRIKRQQALIISQFQKFKKIYEFKEVSHQKMDSFLSHIAQTIQINNSLASNLFEYLAKNQVESIFNRVNLIFNDLIDKYRKCNNKLFFLQSTENIKQIRQICDVCHQKIETNRIQNIRKGLNEQSQCRTALIKKLIEESQLERTTPLFTQTQDRQFKRQLQKVFQNKELMLQTNIHQSNIFLATVEEEIAQFMISFRRDFAQWGGQSVEEQNENWGKMMKGYINKKLTNSFNTKIPNWIKKMHGLFVDHQPTKVKQYFTNKQCQINFPTQNQEKLIQQVEDLNHTLIMKREALKEKQREIEHEKIRSNALQNQIQSIQKYYVDKLYTKNKKQKNTTEVQEILTIDNIRHSIDAKTQKTQDQKTELGDMQTRSIRNKKKLAKMKYQILKSSYKQIMHINNPQSQKMASSALDIHENNSSRIITPLQRVNQYKEQTENLKLKKKAYTRQNRGQILSEVLKQQKRKLQQINTNKDQIHENHSVKRQKQTSKIAIKATPNQINNTPQIKKSLFKSHSRRFNSISVTEDISNNLIVSADNNSIFKSQQKVAIPHKQMKQIINFVPFKKSKENLSIKRSFQEANLNQGVAKLIQLSKCEQLITESDKNKLNKMVYHFFNKLQYQHSNSLYYNPIKISKVSFISNKQNDLSQLQSREYLKMSKSVQKSIKHHQKTLQKSKSNQTNILKLPAISIQNYNRQQEQDLSTLSKNSISLFIDENSALQFQLSFNNGQEKMITKPTPAQFQQIQNMFSQLELVKRKNSLSYTRLCTFLRYPYTSSTSAVLTTFRNCDLSFATFCNYFLKILFIHRDCLKDEGDNFCIHIQRFKRKLDCFLPNKNKKSVEMTSLS